jgi:folate-binding Fe-S cluster repair protein YgfZ
VVARLHFRGHVNKYLRRLVAPHALAPRAIVVSDDGKEVGDVRSSVVSPHFGPIAIAMLRRELRDGDEVIVRDGNVEHVATVAPLGQQ